MGYDIHGVYKLSQVMLVVPPTSIWKGGRNILPAGFGGGAHYPWNYTYL